MANFRAVKPIFLLIALAGCVQAELLATFHTTQGNVVVALQYDTAPQAVANFITLAQGTRPWVDSSTGRIRKEPFYDGIKIHRTANDSSFKFAQGGSPKGDGSDGPGYTFKDEFHATMTHVPYVLSMANSGAHTNGSQFFFTGSLSQPTYNNVHTIFGLVAEPASRTVVDAMISAGPNGTTILGISFARTDSVAAAFDEHAQNLPVCSGILGTLSVNRGVEAKYTFQSPRPAGTVFQGYRSADMTTWTKLGEVYQGTGASGGGDLILDAASLPRAFYQLPLVTYPDALAPASTANRKLVAGVFGTATLTFQFDASGEGGTVVFSGFSGQTATITGVSYSASPYKAKWIVESDLYDPFRIQGKLNSANSTHVIGTSTTEQWNGFFWTSTSSGSLSLTK